MNISFYLIYCLSALILSLLLSHLLGYLFSRKHQSSPATIFNFMPGLPSVEYTGGLVNNWEKVYYKIKRKVIHSIKNNPINVDSNELSGVLGERIEIIQGILEEISNKIPCKIKVTNKGKMIYTFNPDDLEKFHEGGIIDSFKRFLLTVIVFIANIGAIWPFILIIALGAFVLTEIFSVIDNEGFGAASVVLLLTGALFAVILLIVRILGKVFYLFQIPLVKGPKILKSATDFFKFKLDEDYSENFRARAMGEKIAPLEPKSGELKKKSKSGGGGFSFGDIFSGLDDIDGAGIFIFVLIAFVALLGWIVFSVVLWFKNIIQSVWKRNQFNPDMAPSEWTHSAVKEESFTEKIIPGNDLILKFLRSVKNFLSRQKPADRFMSERILQEAKKKNGVLSALELALFEETSLKDAADIGARLVSKVGGDIAVSESGDMVFVFPDKVLQALKEPKEQEYYFDKEEICNMNAKGSIDTLSKGAPVNIPGISSTNYTSLFQLVSGSCLLAAAGVFLLIEHEDINKIEKGLLLALPMIPFGVFILSGIFGYAVKTAANNGFLRDIARSTIRDIKQKLITKTKEYNASHWADYNYINLKEIFKGFRKEEMLQTVEQTCRALGMDLDMEAMSNPKNNKMVFYNLINLYKSLESVEKMRQSGEIIKTGSGSETEVVVFETVKK